MACKILIAQRTMAHLGQAGLARPIDVTGAVPKMPATYDSGYDREAAAIALEQAGCDPDMATGRQHHHALEAEGPEPSGTATDRMAAQAQTSAGRALYASRNMIVEPVCGQIKAAQGFRRLLLRGVDNMRGEWRLVCLPHNLLKLWRYAYAPITVYGDAMGRYMPTMTLVRTPYLTVP